jgi:hypothetical protein
MEAAVGDALGESAMAVEAAGPRHAFSRCVAAQAVGAALEAGVGRRQWPRRELGAGRSSGQRRGECGDQGQSGPEENAPHQKPSP